MQATLHIALGLFLSLPAAAGAEQMCPMIYQPVCATRAEVSRTFANRCLAEAAGYSSIVAGRCGESGFRSRLRVKPIPASAAPPYIPPRSERDR